MWLMTRVARGFIVMAVLSFRCVVGRYRVREVTKVLQERVFDLASLHQQGPRTMSLHYDVLA